MASRKPINPAVQRPPKLEPIFSVKAPPKLSANAGAVERLAFFGQNVLHQLTCSTFRKIVVASTCIVGPLSVHWLQYRAMQYNFQVQQSTFFKESISCMKRSKEVLETYGREIKLGRPSVMTMTSGVVPWLRERHVWLEIKGNRADGWIRIGLARTPFSIDRATINQLAKDSKGRMKWEMSQIRERMAAVGPDGVVRMKEDVEGAVLSEEGMEGAVLVEEGKEGAVASTEAAAPAIVQEAEVEGVKGTSEVVSEASPPPTAGDGEPMAEEETVHIDETMGTADLVEKLKTAKEKMDNKALAEARIFRTAINQLYPSLGGDFTQNDLDAAMKLRQDKEVDIQLFDNTWDLRSVSVHPAKEGDAPVYVLWDPEESFAEDGPAAYLIQTRLFSIRKPKSMVPAVERCIVNTS